MSDRMIGIRKWRWLFLLLAIMQVDTLVEAVATLDRHHSLGRLNVWGVIHYGVAAVWLILGPALWWWARPKKTPLQADLGEIGPGAG